MLKVIDKKGNTLKLRKVLRGPKVVWSVQYKQDPPITLNSITNSLAEFCRDRELSYPAMISVADGRQKTYKGWTCKRVSRSKSGLEMSPVGC